MAIPWIFPPITSGKYTLIDWWITNNFPVDIAKKEHPRKKIIWIYLNKFIENQKIDTLIENLTVSYEILLRASSLKKFKLVDHLFYKNIKIKILDTNKKGMEKLFIEWYKDCLKEFKK
jgi:predicted acylesterase/phospholipase RssA